MATTQAYGAWRSTEEQDKQPFGDAGAIVPPASPMTADALARLLDLPLSAAAALLEDYGSLAGLRCADPATLRRQGLTPCRASRLVAALDLASALLAERSQMQPQVTTPADVARLLLPEMSRLESEQLRVLLLNTKNRLIAAVTLYNGTVSACHVRVAEVFREAVRRNATGLILVHNHPSNNPSPSPEDVAITREVVQAGRLLDITVLDHLVVGGDTYTSLRERGAGWE